MTIPDVLKRAAQHFGPNEGLVDGDTRLTFAELHNQVSEVARLAGEQAKFVADLLEKTARLVVRPATVEQLGSGVWRVNVEAVNEGKLPTRTAMGVKVRRLPPTRWTIGLDRARVLAGDRVVRMDAVAAGGEIRGSWTITGSAGDKVSITLESPECGTQVVEVVLGAVEKKEGRP